MPKAAESSRPSRIVRAGIDDERPQCERVPLARQPEHRRGQQVERAEQVEEERRVEEELRIDVPTGGREAFGDDDRLVDVDEAVGQPIRDALEAQDERHDQDDGEQQRGGGPTVVTEPRRRVSHAPVGCSSTVAPPLDISRKQLTPPVWHAGPAGSTASRTVS